MRPTRWIKRVRDAITGRFVKKSEALSRPESTVTERQKKPKAKP